MEAVILFLKLVATGAAMTLVNAVSPDTGKAVCEEFLHGTYERAPAVDQCQDIPYKQPRDG